MYGLSFDAMTFRGQNAIFTKYISKTTRDRHFISRFSLVLKKDNVTGQLYTVGRPSCYVLNIDVSQGQHFFVTQEYKKARKT